MWSSRTLAAGLLALGLAGCGFRPMYAPIDDTSVLEAFATVEVGVIQDRIGQQLRISLQDLLTPRGRPAQPIYVLQVDLDERFRDVAVRQTGLATRRELTVTAEYALTEAETGEIVLRHQTSAFSSYNLLESDYATLIAGRAARTDAVELIAQDIRDRLGVYFTARLRERRVAG